MRVFKIIILATFKVRINNFLIILLRKTKYFYWVTKDKHQNYILNGLLLNLLVSISIFPHLMMIWFSSFKYFYSSDYIGLYWFYFQFQRCFVRRIPKYYNKKFTFAGLITVICLLEIGAAVLFKNKYLQNTKCVYFKLFLTSEESLLYVIFILIKSTKFEAYDYDIFWSINIKC